MTKEIRNLQKWLRTSDNTPAKLAFLLNYRQSTAINNWIANDNVPFYMRDALKRAYKAKVTVR